jgi:hypothetical protein
MTASIDKEIKHYLPLLENEEKQSLLSQIKSYLAARATPNQLTRKEYLIQYNKELAEAEKDIENGFFITQEELEKEAETWLK